jgi:glycosyltransferase involved in cell wall biosynthesis
MNKIKPKNTIIYGIGINDADYEIYLRDINGKRILCPYYRKWTDMIRRCYKPNNASYNGVTVNPIWHRFSNFKKWMEEQPYWFDENMELDKDILIEGNREYGPDACVFIPKKVNNFFKSNNTHASGVKYTKNRKKAWQAVFSHKYFGRFLSKEEAHLAYLNAKIKAGEELANTIIKEEKVKIAFLNRLIPYRNQAQSLTESLAKPSTALIIPV